MKRELPARKNNRLKGYDYSQEGRYFITICVKDRRQMLGSIDSSEVVGAHTVPPNNVRLSDIGTVVDAAINSIGDAYEDVEVSKYVVMPNHIHIIIALNANNGETVNVSDNGGGSGSGSTLCSPTSNTAPSISRIVKQYKEHVTKQIGFSLWQKSFYDHIIRDESEYQAICQYIDSNPENWENDRFFVKD